MIKELHGVSSDSTYAQCCAAKWLTTGSGAMSGDQYVELDSLISMV